MSTEEIVNSTNEKDENHNGEDLVSEHDSSSEHLPPTNYKTSIAGVAGNVLEWYDFAIFGYFSDIIGDNFFTPNQEGNAALIESYAVFGLAFLVRPIGGAIIGKFGDIYGRKRALEISILLMSFPTFALGCLPTYSQVGWLSTVLLILMRVLQGFSVGGQFMSSTVFTLERADSKEWGFWGSTVYAAASVGVSLGSLFAFLLRENLSENDLIEWGWRIPFWFGIFGAMPAIYLRSQPESHIFPHSSEASLNSTEEENLRIRNELFTTGMEYEEGNILDTRKPLEKSFHKSNLRNLIGGCLLSTFSASGYYILFVWFVVFMDSLVDPPIPHAFGINTILGIVSGIFFTLMGGWIADVIGNRVYVMIVSGSVVGIAFPFVTSYIGTGLEGGEITPSIQALIILLTISIPFATWAGASIPFFVSLYPTDVRLTSASIAYNTAISVWGGFSPLIATVLVSKINNTAAGLFVSMSVVLSFIGLWLIQSESKDDESAFDENEYDLSEPLL